MQPQCNVKLRGLAYSTAAYCGYAHSNVSYSKYRFCAGFDAGLSGGTSIVI